MMIDFPHADTVGERYAAPNGVRYQWSGSFWFAVDDSAVFCVGLFVDSETVLVPADVTIVCTTGYSRPGLGAETYVETDLLPEYDGGFATNNGTRFWKLGPNSDHCITAFGAIPDSDRVAYLGTNNSTMINNAINYVATLPGGGRVTVPSTGIFACDNGGILDPTGLNDGAIYLKTNVTLEGRGGWLVRKTMTDPLMRRFHLIRIDGCQHAKVMSLNLDGNYMNQNDQIGAHMIRSKDSQHVQISFNVIWNSMGYTIASDLDIDDIKITFNTIYESAADGIDFHNSGFLNDGAIVGWNVIIGFGFVGNPKGGIHGRGHRLLVIGNSVNRCYGTDPGISGILLGNGEDESGQTAIGNNVEMGTLCALARGITCNNPNTVVTSNFIVGDTGTLVGIAVHKSNTTLNSNVICPPTGLTLGSARDGISIAPDSTNVSLMGNIINGCGGSGVNDQGTGTKYTNNQSNNNARYAYDCSNAIGAILDFMNTGFNNGLGLLARGPGTIYNQPTDLDSTPSFPTILIRNNPVNATDAINAAYLNTVVGSAFVPLSSGRKSNIITGDLLEHVFMIGTLPASKIIPGGAIGQNGNIIVKVLGSNNASGGRKTYRVRLGGLSSVAVFMIFQNTTSISCRLYVDIFGQDSLNLQKGWAANNPGFGASAATPSVETTVDMSVDQPIVITGQLNDNPADQMWLDAFSIRLMPAPGLVMPVPLDPPELLLQ